MCGVHDCWAEGGVMCVEMHVGMRVVCMKHSFFFLFFLICVQHKVFAEA